MEALLGAGQHHGGHHAGRLEHELDDGHVGPALHGIELRRCRRVHEQGRATPVQLFEPRSVVHIAEIMPIPLRLDADAIELENVERVGCLLDRRIHVVHRHGRECAEPGGVPRHGGGEPVVDGPRLPASAFTRQRLGHPVNREDGGFDGMTLHHGELLVDRPRRQAHRAELILVDGGHEGRNQRVAVKVDERSAHDVFSRVLRVASECSKGPHIALGTRGARSRQASFEEVTRSPATSDREDRVDEAHGQRSLVARR